MYFECPSRNGFFSSLAKQPYILRTTNSCEIKKSKAWNVEETPSYEIVHSAEAKDRKNILILVAKPKEDTKNFEEIKKYLEANHLHQNSHMERGHIYNLNAENVLPTSAPIVVFYGGCGGYDTTDILLKQAPQAKVVATREIGRGNTNNKLYFAFLDDIRQTQTVTFKDVWKKARQEGADLFGYVQPDENNVARIRYWMSLRQ